jgi:GNAT superfamily N-acetyltransferase
MPDLRVVLETEASAADRQRVVDGLVEHNASFAPRPAEPVLTLLLRDENDQVRGGLLGETYYGWLHVSILWVDEPFRGGGYGEALVRAAEEEARKRGCHSAHLDTFSFQARPFYERLGYHVFAELESYPEGHTRYYLRKTL